MSDGIDPLVQWAQLIDDFALAVVNDPLLNRVLTASRAAGEPNDKALLRAVVALSQHNRGLMDELTRKAREATQVVFP